MSLCVASALAALSLAAPGFTLSWVHSVERIEWQERWRAQDGALLLVQARVKGSGAGMEPPPDAHWQAGWWVYAPILPPQPVLWLAVSGATVSGWRLCEDGGPCHELEAELAPPGSGVDRLRVSADAACAPVSESDRRP